MSQAASPEFPVPGFVLKDAAGTYPGFPGIFARTWQRLPEAVREEIEEGLELGPPADQGVMRPFSTDVVIELKSAWVHSEACQPFGEFNADDVRMRLWSDALRLMPEDVAETVIAEELAHCYLRARGEDIEFAKQRGDEYLEDDDAYADDAEERRVAGLLGQWGFESDAPQDWANQHLDQLGRLHPFFLRR